MTMLCVKPNLFCFPPTPPPPKVSFRMRNSYKPLSVKSSLGRSSFNQLVKKSGELLKTSSDLLGKSNQALDFIKSVNSFFGTLGLVYISLEKFYSLRQKYEVGDVIEITENGVSRVCYVHSIGFITTRAAAENGLWSTINHFHVESSTIRNLTVNDAAGAQKLYGIRTEFDAGSQSAKELISKITDIINNNVYVKDQRAYNVVTQLSNKKISVLCYVPSSKLDEPYFKSYLDVRVELVAAVGKPFKPISP